MLFILPSSFLWTDTQAEEINTLINAYQKEFVFLDNEIRLLEKRIKEVKKDGAIRMTKARDNLYEKEQELLHLNSRVDKKLEEQRIVEEEHYSSKDTTGTIDTIITQAASRLSSHDISGFIPENKDMEINKANSIEQELEYVFEQSISLLKTLGSIYIKKGTFYLGNGEEVKGNIINIGRIASFGVTDTHSGTLGPIGGGNLKIFTDKTGKTAQQIADKQMPLTLPIFLYESLDKMAEFSSGNKSIEEIIKGGGIIGIVILIIGSIAVILIIARIIFLWNSGRTDKKMLHTIFNQVKKGALKKAISTAAHLPGAIGRVMLSTLQGIAVRAENVEDVISESVLNEQPRLNSFRSILTVFAAVAPLLGLLGTVTGMIATFDIITQYGTGDPKLLSGGISEALITTEFGLVVAIPVLLIGNLLSSWADRITSGLEVNALRVLNNLPENQSIKETENNDL